MSKILIFTPIFKFINRNDLFKDSEAVYDLIKYWNKDDVKVIVPYVRSFKKIIHFFNKKLFNYYNHGYQYSCDGIDTLIVENQNFFRFRMHYRHRE